MSHASCFSAGSLTPRCNSASFSSPSSIPGVSETDAEFLRQYVELVGHHPNQFSYQGRALVSTFAGDQCTFGQASPAVGWRVARTALERVCPVSPTLTSGTVCSHVEAHNYQIHIIPAFFFDPTRDPVLGCIDGVDGLFHVISSLHSRYRVH